jgi:hypothetical protein
MNEKAGNGGPKPHTRSENHSEENLKKAAQNGESVDDIKGQLEEKEAEKQSGRRFGTFGGVFVPTLLTILGVIMFLRTGWVVGNAGLGGAWLIIAVSFLKPIKRSRPFSGQHQSAGCRWRFWTL